MTYPDIHAALGRERQNTLLADAEAARTARQARLHRRQAATPARRRSPPQCRAGTGTQVVLRDGSPAVIRQVHSDAPLLADGFTRLSAAFRWMRFLRPEDELSPAELRYCTKVDRHDHEAVGALDDRAGRRVQRFTALVADDHAAMAGLLRSMRARLLRRNPRNAEYEICLSPGGDGPQEVTEGLEDELRHWAPARLGVTPAQAEVPQSSSADTCPPRHMSSP